MVVERGTRITKIDHIEDLDSTSKNETTFSFTVTIFGFCSQYITYTII